METKEFLGGIFATYRGSFFIRSLYLAFNVEDCSFHCLPVKHRLAKNNGFGGLYVHLALSCLRKKFNTVAISFHILC